MFEVFAGDVVSRGFLRAVVCTTVLALAAVGSPAAAQSAPPGRVLGQILDPTGAPLPGVLVEVERTDQPAPVQSASSGDDGRYAVDALAPGTYTLRFSLANFVTRLRRGVVVATGGDTTADATMLVDATASVVVTGRSTFRNLSTVESQDELVGVNPYKIRVSYRQINDGFL